MSEFPYYKNQVLPDSLNRPEKLKYNTLEQLLNYLENAKHKNITIYPYCNSVDAETGLVELVFDENYSLQVKGYIERNDVTYVLDDHGEVHIGRCIDCLDNYVGVKVKSIKHNKKDDVYEVKCSRKDVVKEIHDIYNNDIKNNVFTKNMLVKGLVTGMDDSKVFIDIGGDVIGILGVADISRAYVKEPSEVVNIGDVLDLCVKQIYADPIKISLSREMLLPGWDEIDKKYKVGKIVPGIIKNRIATGIFVELDESFEGLAEFPANGQKYNYGDRVKVKINVIDKKRQKIKLKIITNR